IAEGKRCVRCKEVFKGKSSSKYCSDNCKFEERQCPECTDTFLVPFGATYKKTFCSNACRCRNSAKHVSICECCGEEFIGKKHKANKFCSRKCFYKAMGYTEHGLKPLSYLTD